MMDGSDIPVHKADSMHTPYRLLTDEMFPAASQNTIRLVVHFRDKKFMVSPLHCTIHVHVRH